MAFVAINFTFAELGRVKSSILIVEDVFACCTETRTEGIPGESGYSSVTISSCYSSSPPREGDMTQACHQAGFRASRLASILANY